jgi:redox-sensitive bicupin YhaK (pirin superfamily)
MRTIKQIKEAVNEPVAGLITYQALPHPDIDHLDPFLLLNHHGYQVYPKNNAGLPFGPHPHRGFETVTFILEGDLTHKDSHGAESIIKAGGVQWMTAGKGLIHAEISSPDFLKNGGDLEIIQLWLNLPASLKMTDPAYVGLQKKDIPSVALDHGRVVIHAVSGNWEGTQGAFKPIRDVQLASVYFKPGGLYAASVDPKENILFYVVKGNLKVNEQRVHMHQLVEFNPVAGEITVEALEESIILFGHAAPYHEAIVSHGPFVMNTEEEIKQAYKDYRSGVFGDWKG